MNQPEKFDTNTYDFDGSNQACGQRVWSSYSLLGLPCFTVIEGVCDMKHEKTIYDSCAQLHWTQETIYDVSTWLFVLVPLKNAPCLLSAPYICEQKLLWSQELCSHPREPCLQLEVLATSCHDFSFSGSCRKGFKILNFSGGWNISPLSKVPFAGNKTPGLS